MSCVGAGGLWVSWAVPALTSLPSAGLAAFLPGSGDSPQLPWEYAGDKEQSPQRALQPCLFSAAALALLTSGFDGPTSWGCHMAWGAGLCSRGPPTPFLSRAGIIHSCIHSFLCACYEPNSVLRDEGLAVNKTDPGPCPGLEGAVSCSDREGQTVNQSTNKLEYGVPGSDVRCGEGSCQMWKRKEGLCRGALSLLFHEATFEPIPERGL